MFWSMDSILDSILDFNITHLQSTFLFFYFPFSFLILFFWLFLDTSFVIESICGFEFEFKFLFFFIFQIVPETTIGTEGFIRNNYHKIWDLKSETYLILLPMHTLIRIYNIWKTWGNRSNK